MGFKDWFRRKNPSTPTSSRNQHNSARLDKTTHKKVKMTHGGPRENSGGAREGAGRKYKEYPAIEIDYNPDESKETLLRFLREIAKWTLEDKIYYRKAATLIHSAEAMAELRIPSEWEEDLSELKAEAKRLRDAIRSKK